MQLIATIVERGQSRALVRVNGESHRVLVGDRIDRSLVTAIRDREIEIETNGRRSVVKLASRDGSELLGAKK